MGVRQLSGGSAADDFDGDGLIDVLVTSIGFSDPMHLFRNRGDGTFTDVSEAAGLAGLTGGLNLVTADYDNDGDVDVFVVRGAWAKEGGRFPDSLLQNRGDGTFEDVTHAAGMVSFHPSQAAVWLDYDGDGWLDLFIGNETAERTAPHPCELYHNNRDGTFSNVAPSIGMALQAYVKGVTAGDYNNDGRPDLYLSIHGRPNKLFPNEGPAGNGWKFTEVAAAAGVALPTYSFPTWFFDFDNDGDQDVHEDLGGAYTGDIYPNALFANPGHGNHWVKVSLVGKGANRAGIGARLRLTLSTPSGPRVIHRTLNSGGSFGCNPLRLEIGLGDAVRVDSLEIRWPGSGTVQTLKGLAVDSTYRVHEVKPEPEVIRLPFFSLPPPVRH